MKRLKQIVYLFYKSGDNLVENDGVELAGYLTFLAILSIFPFLVLVVAAAGFVGQGEMGARLIAFLVAHLPGEAMDALRPRIDEIISGPPQGLLTVSVLGTIWTSSSVVEGLRSVLNRAYRVSNPPTYVLRRLLSLLQIVLFTALILSVMGITLFAPLLFEHASRWLGLNLAEIETMFVGGFMYLGALAMFIGVASIYYVLPNLRQSLLKVVPGALLVVGLWLAGAAALSLYLQNVQQVNLIYGSLSGFIATLLFFYIMNLLLIYGAEFNHQLWVMLDAAPEEAVHVGESS